MTDVEAGRRPWHLWLVGAASALWNCMGAFDYTMTKTRNADYVAALTPEQHAWIDSFPLWANAGWGLGVWGALAGSILLLFASRFAVYAFAVSLFGLAVTTVFQFGVSPMPGTGNSAGGMLFSLTLWIVAIALLVYAIRMRARGVLRSAGDGGFVPAMSAPPLFPPAPKRPYAGTGLKTGHRHEQGRRGKAGGRTRFAA
ncbi:hypothetical protein [Sphingomonas cavernae]|uniref:hypothetical protein n=1 Tax=Sphingomonas cavernae TaxID=2320861 RepID=UPI0016008F0A|nr:hypothetical protein [Sphingomonas cavernae]